jgi:hypothetical protein
VSNNRSAGGGLGGFIFALFVLWAIDPEATTGLLIGFGVVVALVVVVCIVYLINEAVDERHARQVEQARIDQADRAAAAVRQREECEAKARQLKQRRIDTLGKENAALLGAALTAVKQVAASEAARTGWLPDVEFGPDIKWIAANFKKAHGLRKVADQLFALDKSGADEQRALAEARTTIANLERVAIDSVELIGKCAKEAQLIDESLRDQRRDAKVAEKRAELTAKLSAELYGIEAAPDTAPTSSAVDAVMARAQAYRDIKNHLQQAPGLAQ